MVTRRRKLLSKISVNQSGRSIVQWELKLRIYCQPKRVLKSLRCPGVGRVVVIRLNASKQGGPVCHVLKKSAV